MQPELQTKRFQKGIVLGGKNPRGSGQRRRIQKIETVSEMPHHRVYFANLAVKIRENNFFSRPLGGLLGGIKFEKMEK